MTTIIPTTTRPIQLPDELPEYAPTPHLAAKLRKLAAAGYIKLEEQAEEA